MFQMKPFSLAVFAVAILTGTGAVRAQNLLLKDGQNIATTGVRRDGDSVAAKVKTANGGEGEVGYAVANIAPVVNPPRTCWRRTNRRKPSANSRLPWLTTRPSAICPAVGTPRWPFSRWKP